VSQELLWLWDGDRSGKQEGQRSTLEAGTGETVKGQKTGKTQYVCSDLQTV
jgi:hypothetical protein